MRLANLTPILLPILLSACSLDASNHNTVFLDLSGVQFAQTRHPIFPDTDYVGKYDALDQLFIASSTQSTSAPQTIGGFSCFGINVTAKDIPSTNANYVANYSNDPDCTFPGVSSALVAAASGGATIQLDVPAGPQRTIQVIGLQSTTSTCPSGLLTDHIFDSTITGAYELGRAVGDITTASGVAIKSRFTPDNLKKPFSCATKQPYAYVVNANAVNDGHQGRGSVQGTIQGYKVDRTTGALTKIPGATKTTHGAIDVWAGIVPSNAGKWLYVYVDNFDGAPTAGPYGAQGTVDAYYVAAGNPSNYCGGGTSRLFHNAEIEVYSINQTDGSLTLLQTLPTGPTETNVADLVNGINQGTNCSYGGVGIDPYDQILFVGYGDTVAAYQINQTDGTLGASPQILAGTSPSVSGFALSPDGTALYAPNVTNVSGFKVGNSTTAPLTAMSAPFSIDTGDAAPYQLSLNPEGRFIYSANQDGTTSNGITQFSVNTDGTLTLVPGPSDPGSSYPKVLVDPYYGTTLYGARTSASTTGGGYIGADKVNAFTIDSSTGKLGTILDSATVPNTTLINSLNDMTIDPWSNYIIAAYDTSYLVTFGLQRNGKFSGAIQSLAVTGASSPLAIAIAMVKQ
ncbi:MAG: hypothetical protein ACXWP5_03970 [Bdellovibrionota bacterium]